MKKSEKNNFNINIKNIKKEIFKKNRKLIDLE